MKKATRTLVVLFSWLPITPKGITSPQALSSFLFFSVFRRVDVLLRLIKATRKTTSSLQPPTDFRFIQSVALWHCTTKLRIGLEGDG